MTDFEVREAREEDLEAVYGIVEANRIRVFGSVEGFELEHMRNLWPLLHAHCVATWRSEVVGAAALSPVMSGVEVDVRLDLRRRGIGTRLLQTVEARARREVLEAFPVTLEPAGAPFLRANGYEKVAELWLMAMDVVGGVPEPAWPERVEVRTFADEDARELWNLLKVAYAEEATPVPPFDEWRRFMLGDPSFEAESWFLAQSEGELVGAVLNWNDAFVKDLVVHPGWRRRGLGKALMHQTLRHFAARGQPRITLKTDSSNPTQAWRLYEQLGFGKERTYEVFEKRLT